MAAVGQGRDSSRGGGGVCPDTICSVKKKKVVPESDCDRNDGARKAEEIRDHRSKEMG